MMSSGLMKTEPMTANQIWEKIRRCLRQEQVVRAVLCRRSLTPNDYGGPGCNMYGKTGHIRIPLGDFAFDRTVRIIRPPKGVVAFCPDGWHDRYGVLVRPYPVTEEVSIMDIVIPAWGWYPEAQ